jgi:quinol-cytochrome oxidoreductase complex cytochrome b subunit
LTRATRVGVALAGFLLAVLTASGAWLWWNYRPDRDEWIRVVHQVAAVVLLIVAVALVVLSIVRRTRTGAAGIVAAVAVFVTTGAAYVLGRLLPWEQLALWAVTSGDDDLRLGVDVTFDDRIKFIIVRGREVSASTYHWWAIAHLVLSALALLALVMVWLRARGRDVSRRALPAPPAGPPPGLEANPVS